MIKLNNRDMNILNVMCFADTIFHSSKFIKNFSEYQI